MNDKALSRIYREGAWPEPSRQIDQAILAASRRAAREQRSFARRWAPSFAIAATVMLTSAIVLKVVRERPEVVSPAVSEKDTGIRAMRSLPEPKAEETKPAPAPAAQPATPPRGFSSMMDTAEAERLDRLQRDLDTRRSPPPSESPSPAPKSAFTETPALKKEPPTQRAAPPPTREQRQANAPLSVFGAQAPAAAPPAAPTPSPAPAPAAEAPPAAAPSTPLSAPIRPGGVSALSIGAAKVSVRTPQAWIEDIRKLMKEGKSEEAGAELVEFKKRYPDYVLPEDLR